MVLISIAVHGLSIPFFTFGRRVHSVSRTWSRHDTFGTFGSRRRSYLPEWTTQIRHVQPGEEIVINRDQNGHAEGSVTPVEATSSQEEKQAEDRDREQDAREKGEVRGENPPDGTEVLAEWKEGPHNVIERRRGPGDEVSVAHGCYAGMYGRRRATADHSFAPEQVEVEVQRNAFGPSATTTHTLQVAGEASQRVVDDLRHKMRHAPQELEKTLNQAEQGIKNEAHEIEGRTREVGSAAMHALSPQTSPSSPRENGAAAGEREQDEEDEGWMSDQSAGEPSGSGVADKARGKSPKHKGGASKGSRKRISIRRGLLGQRPQTIHYSQSEDNLSSRRPAIVVDGDEDESRNPSGARTPADQDRDQEQQEERRGRSSAMRSARPVGSGSGTHTPAHLRPTHRRIDSIRSSAAPSREMSPARSVRFADDVSRVVSSGLPSPRSPTTPATPNTGTPLLNSEESQTPTETEQQEDDSPRNTVRFSLPENGHAHAHPHSHSHSHSHG